MDPKIKVENLKSYFADLRPSSEWSFRNVGRPETNYITHGYHRYPAKFIPQIVQKLIEDYTKKNDLVIDPFGGCGTTLVESKVRGRRSCSFDINPVAKLIAKVKVTPIKPITLEHAFEKFLLSYGSAQQQNNYIRHERISYWFDQDSLQDLSKVYAAIKTFKNPHIQQFYLCAFSHILKNCSRWLMKSIKPTINAQKLIPDPLETFVKHLRFMMKRSEQFYNLLANKGLLNTPAQMRIADSTKKLPLANNIADLIVTSPPYVTSYEYADLHQLSLLWLGSDTSIFKQWRRHLTNYDTFRKSFVGTNLRKSLRIAHLGSPTAHNIVASLAKRNISLANRVERYFLEMNKSLAEMNRVLKPGGKLCTVIGDTSLRGVEVQNAVVISEQLCKLGLSPIRIIKREVSNKMITPWRDKKTGKFTEKNNPSKQRIYEHEYVVVMEKT